MKVFELFEGVPSYPSQPIGDLAVVPWLKDHGKKFLSNPRRIWRGSNDKHPIVVTDTNSIKRVSRNTYNFYTLWMDNHPSWEEYPKRSSSLICSSNSTTSHYYNSDLRLILPDDNCKIGVCPKPDLWVSFKGLNRFFKRVGIRLGDMDTASTKLSSFFSDLISLNVNHPHDRHEEGINDINWSTLKSALEEITSDLIRDYVSEAGHELKGSTAQAYVLLARMMERRNYENFYQLFGDIMSPNNNGFKLITPAELNSIGSDNEIWVGGGKAISLDLHSADDTLRGVFNGRPADDIDSGSHQQDHDQSHDAFH